MKGSNVQGQACLQADAGRAEGVLGGAVQLAAAVGLEG